MTRFAVVFSLGLLMVSLTACHQHSSTSQSAVAEPYIADKYSVGFDIAPLPSASGARLWLATYVSQGKVAKFRIELEPSSPQGYTTSDSPTFTAANGSIQAEPGSDASVLLADLKRALEAKHLPAHVHRSSNLPFTFAILGENQSQAADGGFNEKPRGNWTAMKIFIGFGAGNDYGEVFLNLNQVSQKAQFSEKDQDYGDYVLTKLATVL
jgi:hypothetical protein